MREAARRGIRSAESVSRTPSTGHPLQPHRKRADVRVSMPEFRRSLSRDRVTGAGLQTRLIGGVAALVLACGGFVAYRSTGEAEAVTVARGFARSLTARDVRDVARIRARLARLSGVHPDLTRVAVDAAPAGSPVHPHYRVADDVSVLTYTLVDGEGQALAILELRFAQVERAEAFAAGRREVLLAGVGAALLLVIGIGLIARRLVVGPVERLANAGIGLAAGHPGPALGWRRGDAVGVLAASLDALGGTMQAMKSRIEGLALKDPLTGVLNHRGLHDALHGALEGARARSEKVAVVVLDIDDFEQLNDAHGHAAGDEALRMAARVLQRELRPGDICGRIGGDEFLLALVDTDAWGAERVVERLRHAVAAAPAHEGRAGLCFSAGIAEFPRDARDQVGLMRLADGALYRAKRSGRNRCVVYSSFVDAPLSLQEEADRARTAGLANTVYALARAVDLKDGYTHQHSARVAQYGAVLARELGMSEEEIDQIRTAGILHDVGKVGVADAVLLKPARLT